MNDFYHKRLNLCEDALEDARAQRDRAYRELDEKDLEIDRLISRVDGLETEVDRLLSSLDESEDELETIGDALVAAACASIDGVSLTGHPAWAEIPSMLQDEVRRLRGAPEGIYQAPSDDKSRIES